MTVMIKSWTGEMVPLRVGMGVRDNETGAEWVVDEDNFCQCCVDNCAMISCPFAAGDRIEILVDDNWFFRDMLNNTIVYNPDVKYNFPIRHANPNLRTKPEGDI